jgi:predicted ATPase
VDAVVEYLASKNLLLLLDNCEHLLDASADLSATLLTRCPRLRVLATSREPLGVSGEVAWRVPSLQTLDSREQPSVDRLLDYEAARLFVERARLVQPEFGVTEANASALAEICRQLDGIPLAIELAAARVRVLTPEQIARRLDHDLGLLSGGSRTALPRQRTLKATLDWSYDLLDEPERALLGRLSVFAGGFRLEAADKVCSGEGIQEPQALDLLAQLVDKSLVEVESREREARYRLLEPIRQYAWEHLAESGEAEAVRRRHVAWLVEYVQQGERENYGPDERLWLRKVASEQGNVRAALRWCLDNDSDTGLLIAGRVWRYWQLAGHDAERQRWVGEMLSRAPGRTEARRIVLFWSGVDARDRGGLRTGEAAAERIPGDRSGARSGGLGEHHTLPSHRHRRVSGGARSGAIAPRGSGGARAADGQHELPQSGAYQSQQHTLARRGLPGSESAG